LPSFDVISIQTGTHLVGSEHVGVYAEQISPTPYDAMTGMAPTLGPMNYATVEIHDDGDDAGLFGFDRDSAMSVHENASESFFCFFVFLFFLFFPPIYRPVD